MRELGIVRDYDGLHRLLRQRANELEVSRLTLDEVAGLATGHSSKLLSPLPSKHFGLVSLGPMLETLGLVLIVAESADPAVAARVQRMPKRNGSQVRSRTEATAAHPSEADRGNPWRAAYHKGRRSL